MRVAANRLERFDSEVAVTTSVVIAGAPGVFGDLLERVIQREPGFTLIARVSQPAEISAVGQSVDVLIGFSSDGSVSTEALQLLDDDFCSTAVAVSVDGMCASRQRQNGTTAVLQNPSLDEFMFWIGRRSEYKRGDGA